MTIESALSAVKDGASLKGACKVLEISIRTLHANNALNRISVFVTETD